MNKYENIYVIVYVQEKYNGGRIVVIIGVVCYSFGQFISGQQCGYLGM